MKKLKIDIKPKDVVKGVAQTAAGMSASMVVYYAVKTVTPRYLHPVEKVVIMVGGSIIESIAYAAGAHFAGKQVDEACEMMSKMTENNAEEIAEEAELVQA